MSKLKLFILLSPMISIAAEKPVSETVNVSNPSSAETASLSDQSVSVSKCSRRSLLSVTSLASRVTRSPRRAGGAKIFVADP